MPSPSEKEMSVFADALELTDPAERNNFLDTACAGDPALRARVDRLLLAAESADAFFTLIPESKSETATTEAPAPEPGLHARLDAPARIGRYQLVQRLGEGGCGVVYLAEQQEPVRRPVALKIIRLGMDTESVIARFEMERQSLALMDHPNIARVLDAGATETGRPYFVMEVVRGVKITDYGDQHRLDVAARLDLFVLVCHAIQHAHQKGVVHLDIKPSNILILVQDGRPTPKLIDFGIARATGGQLAKPASAAGASFVGTPSYMSPEQAETRGADVDTRGDIYSLGVLLGELLAGHLPFDSPPPPSGADVEELRRVIRERRVRPPSALFTALAPAERERVSALRRIPARRLQAILRDDLDHIVLKALQPDRRHRYETAGALATDLRRWRDHEPVGAHPRDGLYLLRKLVRRHRGVFVAGALVTLALVAGLGASTWLFLRERAAHAEAELARAGEVALREQAESREKISRAAVHLSHGDIARADALVADLPLAHIPPSLECANLMRALGDWHALAGRWGPAAARYEALTPALTRIDPSDSDDVSRNLVPAAAALCEHGDQVAYERFRRMAISRFALTTNPIVAEQIIKASLLMPADAETVRRLEPLAGILVEHEANTRAPAALDPYMSAWRALSLGLLAYRQNNYADAVAWARRCLAYPDHNPARAASAHAIIAMAAHRLGRDDESEIELDRSRTIISDRFGRELAGGGSSDGFWFDWINARLLLREAAQRRVEK